MSEKMFKLSKNYRKLWGLLKGGATVVYQIQILPKVKVAGLIENEGCQHIALTVRFIDEENA